MKKINLKVTIPILVAAFLVFGLITTYFVFTQIVPDEREGTPGGGPWEDYNQSWEYNADDTTAIRVDMSTILVEVRSHKGETALISFEGKRRLPEDSTPSEINCTESSGSIDINMRKSDTSFKLFSFGSGNTVGITGKLVVDLPQSGVDTLKIDTFSGDVEVYICLANSLTVSTSSGRITASGTRSGGTINLSTFSGNVSANEITANKFILSTSSGSIALGYVTADQLETDQFSGDLSVNASTISGSTDISTSSGRVTLSDFSTDTLSVETFSGNVTLENLNAASDTLIDTSSGKVKGTRVTADKLTAKTFSGDVELLGLNCSSLVTDTSSGKQTAELYSMADLNMKSFSGNVKLTLPKNPSFDADITTFSGGIDFGFPITINAKANNQLAGSVNGGGHSVRIDTSSGDISLNPAK